MNAMKKVLLVVLVLVVVAALWLFAAASGWLGSAEEIGEIHAGARPAATEKERAAVQAETTRLLGASPAKQVLFGDFHVHTTFSFDAFMANMPIAGGPGTHPPADACDFARFCSALDFWSINDHASTVSPRHWKETVDSIRACNEISGAGEEPDTVAFLGWEWTQMGLTPETHYGHKNVVLRDLEDDRIPSRPIGATATRATVMDANPFGGLAAGAFLQWTADERTHSLARFLSDQEALDVCPPGVPVRALPDDCAELAARPDELFAKLDDWNVASIVIPHGTTWGLYTPPGSDWAKQLEGAMHDDDRQTLFEIYSGHGSSDE